MANGNDNLDDFDADYGDDDAFKDYNQPAGGKTLGDFLSSPAAKIGVVAGVLVLVVGGLVLFGGGKDQTVPSVVSSPSDVKEPPGTTELTPAVKEAVDEFNEQNTEKALRTGTSAMPVPTNVPQVPASFEAKQGAPEDDPLKQWRALQEKRIRDVPITPQDAQAQQAAIQQEELARQQQLTVMSERMTAQMNSVLSGQTGVRNLQTFVVTAQPTPEELAAQGTQQASLDPNLGLDGDVSLLGNDADLIQAQPQIIIPAGKVEYGQLLLEANSDIPGPVLAQIVSGPMMGGRMIGSFQSSDEYIVIRFNTAIDKTGKSYPVSAIAIDPQTTLSGMATERDGRWFKRVILPAAARFIEGTAQAAADSGTTTVSGADGVVESSTRDVDFEQELFNGLEEAASELGDVLEREADRTRPLVRVAAGAPMGIFFLQSVQDNSQQQMLQAQQQQQTPQGGFMTPALAQAMQALSAVQGQQQNPYQPNPYLGATGYGTPVQQQASPFNFGAGSAFNQPSQFEIQQQPYPPREQDDVSDIEQLLGID